jgi:hypothetical protein
VPLIVQLLVTYGPAAETLISQLIQQWETSGAVTITSAQWNGLIALTKQTANAQMLAQLTAAGIDPTSAQGKAFLALTVATAPVAPVAPPATV